MLIAFVILTIAGSAALALLRREALARRAREQAEKRVDFLAYFDPLTSLPNRVQFQEQLQMMLDTNKPVALLLIDLDEFKVVNDTYGHAAGDAVLCHVAAIISESLDEKTNISACLAGDEFAIAVPSDDLISLTAICESLIGNLGTCFTYEGQNISTGMSIGLAVSIQLTGDMSPTVDTLTRVTDFALYASKSSGRNRYTIYDHELERQYLRRRAMV